MRLKVVALLGASADSHSSHQPTESSPQPRERWAHTHPAQQHQPSKQRTQVMCSPSANSSACVASLGR